jgi:serine/threonine protein kinase
VGAERASEISVLESTFQDCGNFGGHWPADLAASGAQGHKGAICYSNCYRNRNCICHVYGDVKEDGELAQWQEFIWTGQMEELPKPFRREHGLAAGAKLCVDREYTFSEVKEPLMGASFIQWTMGKANRTLNKGQTDSPSSANERKIACSFRVFDDCRLYLLGWNPKAEWSDRRVGDWSLLNSLLEDYDLMTTSLATRSQFGGVELPTWRARCVTTAGSLVELDWMLLAHTVVMVPVKKVIVGEGEQCQEIEAGLAELQQRGGGVLMIRPGVYKPKEMLTITTLVDLRAAVTSEDDGAVKLVCNFHDAIRFTGADACGQVIGLTIENSGGHGVTIRDKAAAVVRDNEISCKWNGVLVRGASQALIEGNTMHMNGEFAVQIEDVGSTAIVRKNTLFDNKKGAVDFCGGADDGKSTVEGNILGEQAKAAKAVVAWLLSDGADEQQEGEGHTLLFARALCPTLLASSGSGSIRTQLRALQATSSLAHSPVAALSLVDAGILGSLERIAGSGEALVGEKIAAVVLAITEKACDRVKAQLAACGKITAVEHMVQSLQGEVKSAEDCVRKSFQGTEAEKQEADSDKAQLLKERDELRSRLHKVLASLRQLMDKRGGVLQRCHGKLLEDFMDMARSNENTRLHALEALEVPSDKKQQQHQVIHQLLQSIVALKGQVHGLYIRWKKAEIHDLESGSSSPQKAGRPRGGDVCSVCEEELATLSCGDCDGKLYCDACSSFVHGISSKKSHTPTAVDSTVTEQQSSESYKQQLAVSKRQLEEEQRRLSKLAVPHFPEHSRWSEGLGRLASSNLVVERTLAGDYTDRMLLPGAGGQGVVLKVKLLGEGDGVTKVLKQLPLDDMKTLLSEALVPHMLRHPLLIRVECVFFDETWAYVQTPFYSGGNLHNWLYGQPLPAPAVGASPPPPPPSRVMRGPLEICTMLRQVLQALVHMHAHNVFHRDVKLTNVLVDDGSPVLCDFGVSKMHAGQTIAAVASTVTTKVQASLTPAYAAPEIIKQEAHTKGGEKADIFGFGVCLFEATFGKLPEREPLTYCLDTASKSKLLDGGGNVHDLLQKLLADKPSDRPSADQALLHRYFSDTHEVSMKVAQLHARSVFHGSLAGTKPYPSRGTQFEVLDVQMLMHAESEEERSEYAQLESAFQQCRRLLQDQLGRSGAQLEQRYAFAGCKPEVIASICKNGLLKIGHAKNPSTSTDEGWFGDPRAGVYVGQCSDYVLKYSNHLLPLQSGDTVKIILFKVLPGRVFHCDKVEMGRKLEPDHDSHESPHSLEWYLPLKGQSCPIAVLTIKAEDKRGDFGDDGDDTS